MQNNAAIVEYTLFTNRDIRRLIVPLLIEQTLFLLVGTADTLMVAGLGAASIIPSFSQMSCEP